MGCALRILGLGLGLVACHASPAHRDVPTGSATIAVSADQAFVVALDSDGGQVVVVDAVSGEVVAARVVGGEPSHVAPLGDDRFAVTLRHTGEVVVLDLALDEVARADVGAEPVGVVATPQGDRLYVALSTEDAVVELDGRTLAELRRFAVPLEPRWLALAPGQGALYVASARGRSLRWVDLGNGAVNKAPAPQLGLSVRFTGDPSVSADGEWLVAPGLLVDNETPERPDSLGVSMYYVDVGKWNPSLLVWPLHPGGRPGERPEAILTIADDPSGGRVGSYPSAALFDPDSAVAYAVMESSDLVVSVPMSWRGKDLEPRSLQFAPRAAAFTAAGPRGLAIVGDTVVLDVALDHGLQGVRRDGLAPDPSEWSGSEGRFTRSATPWTFASPTLDPEAEAGRRLFMSATDDEIVMPGSGVSCSTCHLEGRDDALTWPLGPGDRQTPSLRGGLADTAPYTWSTDVVTVADEVTATSSNRMGGDPHAEAADQVAAYLLTLRPVGLPAQAPDAVARGRALFARADVGCAGCHAGPAFTDGQRYALFEGRYDTPTLRGVAVTAPYLHDGRYETLGALLDDLGGQMGDTRGLSADEKRDLEAYLRSL